MQRIPAVKILRDLSTKKHCGAPGHHPLRKVIVEILFRVSFPGIEGAHAGMRHDEVSSVPVKAIGR